VPLSHLQSEILRALAAQRSPESYVAGSTPLHRDGPRFSADIDLFHHREEHVAATAVQDAAILTAEGFAVEWLRQEPGIHPASIERRGDSTTLEWVRDSDFRFYPAMPDALFGYTLRPADLKAAEIFARAMPVGKEGLLFVKDGKPAEPDPERLGFYTEMAGRRRAIWPGSSEIGHAMLERYGKPSP
jgi:hypothetical protein